MLMIPVHHTNNEKNFNSFSIRNFSPEIAGNG